MDHGDRGDEQDLEEALEDERGLHAIDAAVTLRDCLGRGCSRNPVGSEDLDNGIKEHKCTQYSTWVDRSVVRDIGQEASEDKVFRARYGVSVLTFRIPSYVKWLGDTNK